MRTMDAEKALSASAQRVQDALAAAGVPTVITEYDTSARTSAEAASVLGCLVGQIAKSLVFRATSGTPVLVIASGANRVDEAKIAALAGEPIGKADAGFVRLVTGYAIGGIPPLDMRSACPRSSIATCWRTMSFTPPAERRMRCFRSPLRTSCAWRKEWLRTPGWYT